MPSESSSHDSLVISYLNLRKAIGIIGMALPFVLVLGRMLLESSSILSSISSYYYSVMGDVFVGSLCAIGVFLLSYRGYDNRDDIAGNLACAFAVGVALFPTAPDMDATTRQTIIGWVHGFFAACFFLTLAYFALILFRKTNPNAVPTPKKLMRNRIYLFCGSTIIVCIIGIVFTKFFPSSLIQLLSPVFWFESLAILAFGVSWFVKGEAILKDDE